METLDDLAGLANEVDSQAAANLPADPNAPPPPPEPPSHEEQATDLVNGFAGMLAASFPETTEIWTPEACQASAKVLAPLLAKYNFSLVNLPPEIPAALVVGPLLWRSSVVVGDKIREKRLAKLQAQRAASGAPPGAAPATAPAVAVHSQVGLYAGEARP